MSHSGVKSCILWVVAILLSFIPAFNMLTGTYAWQIEQVQFTEGGMVLLVCGLIMFCGSFFCKKNKALFLLLLAAVYLSNQGVIIPTVVCYFYLEALLFLGRTVLERTKRPEGNVLDSFVAGISVWGVGAIICSAFGYGTINDLRIMTVVFIAFAICLKKKHGDHPLLIQRVTEYVNGLNQKEILLFIGMILLVVSMFAKTNSAIDYDSLWYGLRPEKVLIGENSFYDYLGYACFVHYYPKMMELLWLPISGLGDYSFIISMNILCFTLIDYTAYKILSIVKSEMAEYAKLTIVLAIASIPALSNISATAKPDTLGCLLVLIAVYYMVVYWCQNENRAVWVYTALLLCTGTKLTYLMWGGVVFMAFSAGLVYDFVKTKRIALWQSTHKWDWVIAFLAVVLIVGVHYRTYLLTGFPVTPIIPELFLKLGFTPKNYVRTAAMAMTGNVSILHRIYQYMLDPSDLGKVIMLWTSNTCLISVLIYVFNYKKSFRKLHPALLGSGLLLAVLAVYMEVTMLSPDGNYFILPLIVVTLLSALLAFDKKSIIFLPLVCIIFANLVVGFVSHPSWYWGTSAYSSELVKNNFETEENNKISFNYNGIGTIAEYLSAQMPDERVISSVVGDPNVVRRLNAAIEVVDTIGYNTTFNDGTIFQSYENFVAYIQHAKIKGLIVSHDENSLYSEYVQRMMQDGYVYLTVMDQSADFYQCVIG